MGVQNKRKLSVFNLRITKLQVAVLIVFLIILIFESNFLPFRNNGSYNSNIPLTDVAIATDFVIYKKVIPKYILH